MREAGMAITAQQFAAELKAFDDRRKVVQALRKALVRTSRPAVAKVRAHARKILPHRGGLGAWVAKARISPRIGYGARTAGVRFRGSRKSLSKDRSDLVAIDNGRVRHPSWGRRSRGAWHTQNVAAGWWSDPLERDTDWQAAVDADIDRALDELRR